MALAAPVAASALPSGLPLVTGGPWGAWNVEVLDSASSVNQVVSLALNSSGAPIIAYSTGDDGVIVIQESASGWTKTIISSATDNPRPLGTPSLAINATDVPSLSAWDPWNGGGHIVYSRLNGSAWETEVVDPTPLTGIQSDLDLDVDGTPHIVYRDQSIDRPKYAYKTDSGWQNETINATHAAGHSVSLALGPDNTPHVAWSANNGLDLAYSHRDTNGTWTTQILAPGGFYNGIDVDSHGNPHIAYQTSGNAVAYTTNDGTGWNTTFVDDTGSTGLNVDLKLDSHDIPHISYTQISGNPNDPLRGHLKYATQLPNGQWATEFADPQDIHLATSIALDGHDRPHIAYQMWRDQFTGIPPTGFTPVFDLKYAEPVAATALGATGN